MNAEQLWQTTMNPESRTLRQVTIENAAEADHIFSMLMGDEVPPRREFIEKHAKYAGLTFKSSWYQTPNNFIFISTAFEGHTSLQQKQRMHLLSVSITWFVRFLCISMAFIGQMVMHFMQPVQFSCINTGLLSSRRSGPTLL